MSYTVCDVSHKMPLHNNVTSGHFTLAKKQHIQSRAQQNEKEPHESSKCQNSDFTP